MFYLDQIALIVIALLSARHEFYGTKGFRECATADNEDNVRFHKVGFILFSIIGILFAISFSSSFLTFIMLGTLNLTIYMLLFNVYYSSLITNGRELFYLGNQKIDRFLRKRLGKNAGRKIALFLLGTIVKTNILYLIIN